MRIWVDTYVESRKATFTSLKLRIVRTGFLRWGIEVYTYDAEEMGFKTIVLRDGDSLTINQKLEIR